MARGVASQSDIGAIALNWAIYGSSGNKYYSDEFVLSRFHRRAEKDFAQNFHYKTLLKTVAYESTRGNPHVFRLKQGFKYFHTDGSIVSDHEARTTIKF